MIAAAMVILAAAQEPDARLAARLDSATARRVAAVIDSAKRAGLPGEPLVQKALEGQAKGAGQERIVAAVRTLRRDLELARSALGETAPAGELMAGALWLRAGGQPSQLRTLKQAAPGRPLTVPLAASAELVARGWPPEEATVALGRLVAAGVSDEGFLAFRTAVAGAIRDGTPVGRAARAEAARLTPPGAGP